VCCFVLLNQCWGIVIYGHEVPVCVCVCVCCFVLCPDIGKSLRSQVCVCVCCFALLHRYWEIIYGAGVSSKAGKELAPTKWIADVPPRECVLLWFIKPIFGNHYVRSWGFILSEPRETHPRSEIAHVPTSPCPPLDKLGCPDPHPST